MRYRRPPDVDIYLHNIAYGPEGFTCRCGGNQFTRPPLDKATSLKKLSFYCVSCNEKYLFVKRYSGETVL